MIPHYLNEATEIYGVSIRHILLRNQSVKSILSFLKSDYSYILSREVIKLLKFKYYFTETEICPLTDRDLCIRKIILNFNKRRKYNQKIMDYLNTKFEEDIEPDYVFCDNLFELRFGI
jgi:hypothetical protein